MFGIEKELRGLFDRREGWILGCCDPHADSKIGRRRLGPMVDDGRTSSTCPTIVYVARAS
jgi:hypothetical protein